MPRASPKPGPRRSPLLYVEHHGESVAVVEQLLAERKDLLLLCAADLNLAIKLARSKRPEVILINIDVPGFDAGLDAHELMKLLRADAAMQTAPILALSFRHYRACLRKQRAERAFGGRIVRSPGDASGAECFDYPAKKTLLRIAHIMRRELQGEVRIFRQRKQASRVVRHRPRHVIQHHSGLRKPLQQDL